ncbi:hypothetical protein HYALB_00010809 [Hymenoscyphus albidus]|uniref:NADH dehydrogenase [ubiquinone] 1 alpha subcomplex subunit n=1 Tax=Hymenoscyphus albidus TaxID=595503 RepID=A0A9N9LK68_9HELO|nr:hypothetical protein HYALB_00010809 [Hymenoscyphus albidus]
MWLKCLRQPISLSRKVSLLALIASSYILSQAFPTFYLYLLTLPTTSTLLHIHTTMTSRPTLSPLKTAWYKWKSLRWVPGRKKFLVGLDLNGNTFWEFRDALNSHKHKMRRIVQYPHFAHLSDVQVSPQWLQWLRHTRKEAPSIAEQEGDGARRERLKILAQAADERWARKGSFLEKPKVAEGGLLGVGEVERAEGVNKTDWGRWEDVAVDSKAQEQSTRRSPATKPESQGSEDPWKQAKGGPSEEWQPQTWGGGKAPVRR